MGEIGYLKQAKLRLNFAHFQTRFWRIFLRHFSLFLNNDLTTLLYFATLLV